MRSLTENELKYLEKWTGRTRDELLFHTNGGMIFTNDRQTGERNRMYGKKHRKASIEKMKLKAIERENNPAKKAARSADVKARGYLKAPGKGWFWWNNGKEATRSPDCPGKGWVRGRLWSPEHKQKFKHTGKNVR